MQDLNNNPQRQYWQLLPGPMSGQIVIASANEAGCTPTSDVRVLGVDACDVDTKIVVNVLSSPGANFPGIDNKLLWTLDGNGIFSSVGCTGMAFQRESTGFLVLKNYNAAETKQTFTLREADSEVSSSFM